MILPCYLLSGIRVFQIGRTVVIDIARFGFFNIASASFSGRVFSSLFKDVVKSFSKLTSKSMQEYGIITAQNRKLQFFEQISQSSCRQIEAFIETGRRQFRRSAQFIVKQSRGFGSATCVRLEANWNPTHFNTPNCGVSGECECSDTFVSGSIRGLVVNMGSTCGVAIKTLRTSNLCAS